MKDTVCKPTFFSNNAQISQKKLESKLHSDDRDDTCPMFIQRFPTFEAEVSNAQKAQNI